MKTAEFHTPVQTTDAVTEAPAAGPTLIDPSLFALVSGGSPRGGWIPPVIEEDAPPL